jgi:hypothetical protein
MKKNKEQTPISVRLWETNDRREDGRTEIRITVSKGEESSESIALTTHEELYLGVILEWRTGYERIYTADEFLSEMDGHSQIQRIRTWAKYAIKRYSK